MVYESSTVCVMCQGYTFDEGRCVGCGASAGARSVYRAFAENAKMAKYIIISALVLMWLASNIEFGGESGVQEQAPDHGVTNRAQPQRVSRPTAAAAPATSRRLPPRPAMPPQPIQIIESEPSTPFSIPKTTWGAHFNPEGAVPDEGFYAFYFDSANPADQITPEKIARIDVTAGRISFNGINSQHFGAYWVGMITTHEEAIIEVKANKGWNEFRVIIDGSIVQEHKHAGGKPVRIKKTQVYQAGNEPTDRKMVLLPASATRYPESAQGNPLVTLLPGDHIIEIEFLNHWHTTSFSAAFKRYIE